MATSLELAITAIRSGRKDEGRQLLNLLIQQNPNNEMAWLWMSSVVNTDEQRARCLYHVLAINPTNEMAQRGLHLLGITVSDSRPVKVPRDSQPIPIQRAQPGVPIPSPLSPSPIMAATAPKTEPLAPAAQPNPVSVPASQPVAVTERRPFRLDPRTITQELPFVPLRDPFAETLAQPSPDNGFGPVVPAPWPSVQEPVVAAAALAAVALVESPNDLATQPLETAPIVSEPLDTLPTEPVKNPADPAPNIAPALPDPVVLFTSPVPPDTGPLPETPAASPSPSPAVAASLLAVASQQPAYTPPPPYAWQMSLQETRPSQPIWTTHSNTTVGLPQTPPYSPPVEPAPAMHSNATMSMPTPYYSPQPQPVAPPFHSNATMGMPNGVMPYPGQPMPAFQTNTPMGVYGGPVYPPAYPPNPAYHASATMAMPTMSEAEAKARLLASQPMSVTLDTLVALRAAQSTAALPEYQNQHGRSKNSAKKNYNDDNTEEVNLLAVIVFGSLSVTALGGLGMLVLLWVTSV